MKNNFWVFLGFGLICLANMNHSHKAAPTVPAPAQVAAAPVVVQPVIVPSASKLAELPTVEPKKISVTAPVVIHKLRDRQSEAIDASESGPKVDKVDRPL